MQDKLEQRTSRQRGESILGVCPTEYVAVLIEVGAELGLWYDAPL